MFLFIWFGSAALINNLESFMTMLYDFEKQWLSSFAWKAIVCTTKFYLFIKEEGWNFLRFEKKYKAEDFNMEYGG